MKKLKYLIAIFLLSPPAICFATEAITTTRTSGVAPLAVVFSSDTATVASTSGSRPFHTYQYHWDFDETTGETWSNSGKSKDEDYGPIAAHLFETAGTHTVTLTVSDENGTVDTGTVEITVTDPDTVFSTTNTTCVNNSGDSDFTGCPSGANNVSTDDLTTIVGTYDGVGKRVLFKRGGSWTYSTSFAWDDNTGPFVLGAYGTCSGEDGLGICSNAPSFTTTTAGIHFVNFGENSDHRVMDLSFTDVTKTYAYPIGASDTRLMLNNLVLRNSISGFDIALQFGHIRYSDDQYISGTAFFENRWTGQNHNGLYCGSEFLAVVGNIGADSDLSHIARSWQTYKGVFSHNDFSGGDIVAGIRHDLKLHGNCDYGTGCTAGEIGTFAETGTAGLRYHTQFVVVANNVFGADAPRALSLGPSSSQWAEKVSDVIVEKNKIIADYGTQNTKPAYVRSHAHIAGRYMSVRNNIFEDQTGTSPYYCAVRVEQDGVEWTPLGNMVYNNTIYNGNTETTNGGICVESTADDTAVRNNIIVMPNVTSPYTVDDNGTNTTSSNNILAAASYFTDPDNVTPLSRDFSLTASAANAIDLGYDLRSAGVLLDFNDVSRSSTPEIGAFEYPRFGSASSNPSASGSCSSNPGVSGSVISTPQ